jgi:hypothetical protein
MPRGIMYVESRPESPEGAAEFDAWYDLHIGEILSLDGFVAARRYSVVGDDAFVAVYDIEGDDLSAVRARIGEARGRGEMTPPRAMASDPPPVIRLLELIGEYGPVS